NKSMSELPGRADMLCPTNFGSFVPQPDSCTVSVGAGRVDHLFDFAGLSFVVIVLLLSSRECSREIFAPFELPDCAFAERGIAVQIVGVEDRAHVAQRVPGEESDLGLGASDDGEPRDGGAAQI